MSPEPTYHYIGRCRECGACLASVGDMRDRRNYVANSVFRMIAADLLVERTRSETVVLAKQDCGCPRGKSAVLKQEALL